MDTGSSTPSLLSTVPKDLSAAFLRDITDGFSTDREIGQGAFGTVYKGILPEGDCIAVKKLVDEDIYDKQFQNEITHLMNVCHENIVRIVGFCQEREKKVVEHNRRYIIVDSVERFICYEYLPNGSIDKCIFDDTLNWATRFKIIKGICQGLHFLHEGMETPTIHMSLQPANVLLDDRKVPKITDFGSSRVFGRADKSMMITQNPVGVIGYMAPEYLYRGEISTQADIYSLGLMIIEITTRKKNYSDDRDKSAQRFIDEVRQTWTDDVYILSKYSQLDAGLLQEVKACIQTGLKCVDIDRKRRPSISEIVRLLNAAW
ncbi:hypothetical protein SETIT_8G235000v2 [Setaria italica]|uniref:Protein kinase domain-containing protein n=2 Tax=Setaria italica TaxID=4555 RepID=A0A368SAW6_SETIT|nr:cysteine-rich receptor-like protein kinase 29 [Setaria italica]XP_022684841.1 cysteine-rich receptor-like protein kinase 29 [Setaria italica]XP_022684842.1 cysteine-rich receptor-like protein kinase 29 [Setaria italica]RCV39572.1 hypothetical protein SETIT_8G235000v2 [Setaria italica]